MNDDSPGIREVAIIGGGSAGWMAAAMLVRLLGGGLRIRLIESDEIPTVRVGEATIPPIKTMNNTLGIDEDEFVRATHGTFKLAIQFEHWGSLENVYMHAFGGVGQDLGSSFQHYWRRAIKNGHNTDFWDFSLNYQAAKRGKFIRPQPARTRRAPELTYAYHFDAGLYAQYLRHLSEDAGVQRIEGTVVGVELNSESGFVDSVTLASGQTVEADLFIDCTGFRGLLIEEALKTGYEDWSHWLPCDRAVAVATEALPEPPPYTRSIAHSCGWRWWIPLQHRTGNGLVYCSQHLSDEDAVKTLLSKLDSPTLSEPRTLKFQVGRRRLQWNKNCVSLGLSSGFIEPLESTSLHLIQSGITRLVAMFPRREITQVEIDEYNRQSAIEFERIRDFIILHYHVNQRTDSEFWTYCRTMQVPDALRRRIDLFAASGKIFREEDELFSKVAWLQVLIGQGVVPQDHHPVADLVSSGELENWLVNTKAGIEKAVGTMPNHQEFIDTHCRAAPVAEQP